MSAVVVAGLVLAAVAWGGLFGLGRADFWSRAAVAGVAIGAYAVVVQRAELEDLAIVVWWPLVPSRGRK